jgi:hypothetical protein
MADIKDTVASHITTNWNAAVLGGSGAVPTADAVGPEDIKKPEDYPEAILVYNERVQWDRIFAQGAYGDRHTRVYLMLTAHTKTGCTKTHFRAFIDELKTVFGSAISGFDLQILDPEENVTKTKGVMGGMYQATFVLHLWEYGVSTSSASAGGAAGSTYWTEPFVTYSASANLTAERILTLTGTDTLGATLKASADSTYDIGENAVRFAENAVRFANIYCDTLYATALGASMSIGDFALTNVDELQNDAAIKMQPSGDTDDYTEYNTTSGIPGMKIIGGHRYSVTSDHATATEFEVGEDATYWIGFYYDKTGNIGWVYSNQEIKIYSGGAIRIFAAGDTDDYFYFTTVTNVAKLLVAGGDKVHIIADAASSLDNVYSDDFTNTSPYKKLDKPLDKLKAVKDKKVGGEDKLDYKSLPDWVRQVHRSGGRDTPKDSFPEENEEVWSVNRMVLFLIQAVQELTSKVEALEAKA